MRNKWLQEQLAAISNEQNKFVVDEVIKYIEQLEDDNESLQVALEGNIWSPKKWNEKAEKQPKFVGCFSAFFVITP